MTERVRRPTAEDLPRGYQFGDAGREPLAFRRDAFELAMRPLTFPEAITYLLNRYDGREDTNR
jgi:hypothetical protein